MSTQKNERVIRELINEVGLAATPSAQSALLEFTTMFAEKLIRKSLSLVNGQKPVTNMELRIAYQLMSGMHSPDYTKSLQDRREQLIQYVNKDPTKSVLFETQRLRHQNQSQQQPAEPPTVRLFFKQDLEHMRTNPDTEIVYE